MNYVFHNGVLIDTYGNGSKKPSDRYPAGSWIYNSRHIVWWHMQSDLLNHIKRVDDIKRVPAEYRAYILLLNI